MFESRHKIVVGMLKMQVDITMFWKSHKFIAHYLIRANTPRKIQCGRRYKSQWRKERTVYCSGHDPDIVVMRAAMRRLREWKGNKRPWPRNLRFWANMVFVTVLAVVKIIWLHWKNWGSFDPVGQG